MVSFFLEERIVPILQIMKMKSEGEVASPRVFVRSHHPLYDGERGGLNNTNARQKDRLSGRPSSDSQSVVPRPVASESPGN